MSERNKDKANSNAPENDPSKPMNSKREVDKSNVEKIDQDFPGYPHYPAKEDIMDKRTDTHRVDMEVENMPNSKNATGVSQRFTPEDSSDDADADKPDEDDYRDIGPRTEVSKADLKSLGSRNAEIGIPQNTDNDDLILINRELILRKKLPMQMLHLKSVWHWKILVCPQGMKII